MVNVAGGDFEAAASQISCWETQLSGGSSHGRGLWNRFFLFIQVLAVDTHVTRTRDTVVAADKWECTVPKAPTDQDRVDLHCQSRRVARG